MTTIVDISEVLLLAGLSETVTETERAIVADCLRSAVGAVKRHLGYDPAQATHTEYYPQVDQGAVGRVGIWEVSDTQAYVRELAGSSSILLQIKHLPIRSITSLHIDYDGRAGTRAGAFPASTLKVEGVDFWPNYDMLDSASGKVCRDGIIRSEGAWPDIPGSVKIVYVAGYTEAELRGQDSVIDASPINEAVKDETQRRIMKVYSRIKNSKLGFVGALASESLGSYSYSTNSAVFQGLIDGTRDILPETVHKLQDYVRYDLGVM